MNNPYGYKFTKEDLVQLARAIFNDIPEMYHLSSWVFSEGTSPESEADEYSDGDGVNAGKAVPRFTAVLFPTWFAVRIEDVTIRQLDTKQGAGDYEDDFERINAFLEIVTKKFGSLGGEVREIAGGITLRFDRKLKEGLDFAALFE